MKRKLLFILLGAEFAALLILALLSSELPKLFSSLTAFPFEQVGALLRTLSLTGGLGNGFALALYALLCLLPLAPVLRHWGERERRFEFMSLALLSLALFGVLYAMTNPALLLTMFPEADESMLPVIKAVMGAAVWSVVVLWAVLRLLRLFREGDMARLMVYTRSMLYALCALFMGAAALSCGAELISALASVQKTLDGAAAAVRFAVEALPYALDIAVTLSALSLLDALRAGEDSDVTLQTEKLSRLCCLSLGTVTASVAALNVLQLVFARSLSNIAVAVNIPFMSLAFVLAVLLAARLIAENRRLRRDNDLFI